MPKARKPAMQVLLIARIDLEIDRLQVGRHDGSMPGNAIRAHIADGLAKAKRIVNETFEEAR